VARVLAARKIQESAASVVHRDSPCAQRGIPLKHAQVRTKSVVVCRRTIDSTVELHFNPHSERLCTRCGRIQPYLRDLKVKEEIRLQPGLIESPSGPRVYAPGCVERNP